MKQYVIDDLRAAELERLKTWCGEHLQPSCFEDVFWLPLDEAVLTPLQCTHADCLPHYLSLALEADRVVIDMAVRTKRSLHCECMGYIDQQQFAWLDAWVDDVFAELGIKP